MIDKDKLIKRIKKDAAENTPEYYIRAKVQWIIDKTIQELEQNVLEYIDEVPFTEIKIRDLSINDVLNYWKTDIRHLESAVNYSATSNRASEPCGSSFLLSIRVTDYGTLPLLPEVSRAPRSTTA